MHRSPKATIQWAFCTVAIILALGVTWLALEGGEKPPRGISGGSANPYSIYVPANSQPTMLLGWELDLRAKSLEPTAGGRDTARTGGDNVTALALGSTGAVALVGLVLFLAWKLRPSPPAGFKERRTQWPVPMRRAPSV